MSRVGNNLAPGTPPDEALGRLSAGGLRVVGLLLAPTYFGDRTDDPGWPDDPAASSKGLFATKQFVSKIDADPAEIFRQVVGAYAPMQRSIEKTWENQRRKTAEDEDETA